MQEDQPDEVLFDPTSEVIVKVIDRAKNVIKRITCDKTLLNRNMRYFADYFAKEKKIMGNPYATADLTNLQAEIVVQCDAKIFQNLIEYFTSGVA